MKVFVAFLIWSLKLQSPFIIIVKVIFIFGLKYSFNLQLLLTCSRLVCISQMFPRQSPEETDVVKSETNEWRGSV